MCNGNLKYVIQRSEGYAGDSDLDSNLHREVYFRQPTFTHQICFFFFTYSHKQIIMMVAPLIEVQIIITVETAKMDEIRL